MNELYLTYCNTKIKSKRVMSAHRLRNALLKLYDIKCVIFYTVIRFERFTAINWHY